MGILTGFLGGGGGGGALREFDTPGDAVAALASLEEGERVISKGTLLVKEGGDLLPLYFSQTLVGRDLAGGGAFECRLATPEATLTGAPGFGLDADGSISKSVGSPLLVTGTSDTTNSGATLGTLASTANTQLVVLVLDPDEAVPDFAILARYSTAFVVYAFTAASVSPGDLIVIAFDGSQKAMGVVGKGDFIPTLQNQTPSTGTSVLPWRACGFRVDGSLYLSQVAVREVT